MVAWAADCCAPTREAIPPRPARCATGVPDTGVAPAPFTGSGVADAAPGSGWASTAWAPHRPQQTTKARRRERALERVSFTMPPTRFPARTCTSKPERDLFGTERLPRISIVIIGHAAGCRNIAALTPCLNQRLTP